MKTTRCKFQCHEVTKTKYWGEGQPFAWNARFLVVTSGSDENKRFFASTPNGELTVRFLQEDLFEPGKEYYLDITEAS